METFCITVKPEQQLLVFKVIDKKTDIFKFKVYLHNMLMAIFNSDENDRIHLSSNPVGLDKETILSIASKIEAYYR